MTYPAGKDTGTAWAFTVFGTALAGCGIYLMVMPERETATIVAGIVLVLTALLWAWLWFGTAYEITSSHLRIRCGPIRSRIRIDEILEAVPTSSAWLMVGGRHGRFALSRDAILIKGSKKWLGVLPYAALISPADKAGFLRALADASAELEQTDDGTVRRRSETSL